MQVCVCVCVCVCMCVCVCVCVCTYSNRLLPNSFFRRVFIGALYPKWFGKSSPKEKKENIMVKFIFKVFWGVLGHFWGVRVIRFLPKFRIPCRMILVNTVPNPKSVAPKLQKLYNRKVPINVGRTTNIDNERHQSGKTYSLVEMKFRRDKNSNGVDRNTGWIGT